MYNVLCHCCISIVAHKLFQKNCCRQIVTVPLQCWGYYCSRLWLEMIENHKKLPPTLATADAATDAVAAAAADARPVVAVAS